jgi:hypothetical protein
MQLRLRHLDQCSAWVKICEVINYGRNKSIGNEPWSLVSLVSGDMHKTKLTTGTSYFFIRGAVWGGWWR